MTSQPLDWSNYRSRLPKHIEELKPTWEQQAFDSMLLHDIQSSLPAGLVPWQALVMQVVARLTTGKAFPAKIYSGAGRQSEPWAWDGDSRNDLVQDTLVYMLGQGRDDTLDSGNQFIYVIKHADTVDKARRLVSRYAKKVLRRRFRSQAVGHISELLITELKENFRVVPPVSTRPRDVYYSREDLDGAPCFESDQNQSICINEFMLMRRNRVKWGVDPRGKDQSFPRLYNTAQIRAAVSRILDRLEAPVRMGFLEDCLDRALAFLEDSADRQKEHEIGDEDAENPDFTNLYRFGVHSDDLADLSEDEDRPDVFTSGPRAGQWKGVVVTEIVEEMKAKLDETDLEIMRLTIRQLTHEEMGQVIGIAAKTVQRRYSKIRSTLTEIRDESRSDHPSEADPDGYFNQAMSELFAEFEVSAT
jgi:DNA-directed RNA polymerase specialized sigma24 family protein